MPYTKFRLRT